MNCSLGRGAAYGDFRAIRARGHRRIARNPPRGRYPSVSMPPFVYSTAPSSSTNRRFGRAPTSFSTGSPSRKTMNVGIDSTP